MQQRYSTCGLLIFLTALTGFLCFAGCESAQQKLGRSTPLETPPKKFVLESTPVESPKPVPPATMAQPAPSLELPLKPVVATPLQAVEEWIDLAKWCENDHLTAPVYGGGVPPRWKLQVPGGMIEVFANSRFAHWNGMLIGLGYGPRLCKDSLQVYGLDLEKNIRPLTSPFYFKGLEKVVVIDPGHGGVNPGTRSLHTLNLEKNLTLDWALRVKRLLAGTGWTVFLTRTNDIDLTLAQRVAFADETRPDLFVSLHFNAMDAASKSRDEAGVETYCLTPTGMPSNITREFEDDPMKVFPNNQFDSENLQWAVRFHRQLLATTGAHDRGVRRARFMGVVREQRRPAVLIEGGYLSNPREAGLLAESSYREKLAWAVASAIAKQ